jgi:hypothetical protein
MEWCRIVTASERHLRENAIFDMDWAPRYGTSSRSKRPGVKKLLMSIGYPPIEMPPMKQPLDLIRHDRCLRSPECVNLPVLAGPLFWRSLAEPGEADSRPACLRLL